MGVCTHPFEARVAMIVKPQGSATRPGGNRGGTIVVVDDDRRNVELLAELLETWGYGKVVPLTEGASVPDAVRVNDADLVLLDMHMPGMNGFEVLDRLRVVDDAENLPVLAITGDPTSESKLRALAAGARDYIVKPYDPTELKLRVENLLELRKSYLAQRDAAERLSEEVAARTRELAASEALAHSVLDTAVDAIITIDERGSIHTYNRAAERMFGYASDEVEGREIGMLMPTWERAEHDRAFRDYLATGGTRIVGDGRDILGQRKDGTTFPVQIAVSEMYVGGRRMFTGVARDMTALKEVQAELVRQALHDALTGLPNRQLFLEHLRHALDRLGRNPSTSAAVLFLDLDRFKLVNDTYGHQAGDDLLREVARRLQETLRPADQVARFGGDEFAVLLEDVEDPLAALHIAQRLSAAVSEEIRLGSSEISITASIGVAIAEAESDPHRVLAGADAAMYRAKDLGRARYELFNEEMRAEAMRRLVLEHALRDAPARGELFLEFQPLVELANERVIAAEALLRWDHPQLGRLSAGTFVGLAEETGLIVPVGMWVLETACRQARAWADQGLDLRMHVNLSARQLAQPSIVSDVRRVLDETGAPREALSLELTETAVMREPALAHERLHHLVELGVSLAIDDFGTGYSSLAYLRRFPVRTLKIDRSFVEGLDKDTEDSAIVESIVQLAHTLGRDVVAEGVETPGQLSRLRGLGCDCAQGYLFGRPGAQESLVALARRRNSPSRQEARLRAQHV